MIKCLVYFINALIFKMFILVSEHTVQDTSGLSSHLAVASSQVESAHIILILKLSKFRTRGLKRALQEETYSGSHKRAHTLIHTGIVLLFRKSITSHKGF